MTKPSIRLVLLFAAVIFPLFSSGQNKKNNVQRGVVCTSVNPSNPTRKAVPGVRVVIDGALGDATNSKGEFSRQVNPTFKVSGLDKDEYILIAPKEEKTRDKDVLEVVVVSKEQKDFVSNDRFKALKKQYQKQGEDYLQTRNRLQEALDSLDEKDARYQDLKAQYEEMRKLYIKHIEDEDKITENLRKIADELALTDFQTLDTLQQRISELRWNGDWEEIEKYIRSTMKGGAEEDIQRIRQAKTAADILVDEAKAKLKKGLLAQKTAEQEEKNWFFKMENLIEKFKVTHENDSVSKFYEILLNAGPNNRKYLYEAGDFECDFMANYPKSMKYLDMVVALSPKDTLSAKAINKIGLVNMNKGEYEKALESFKIALNMFQENKETDRANIAAIYSNIGQVISICGKGNKNETALEYFGKALDIYKELYRENHVYVALCYDNIGMINSNSKNYEIALDYWKRALAIHHNLQLEDHPLTALIYLNIGTYFYHVDKYPEALSYFNRAIDTFHKSVKDNHPILATCYSNIAVVYSSRFNINKDLDKAIEYEEKALKILINIFGESHQRVANSYESLAELWDVKGNHIKYKANQEKAAQIRVNLLLKFTSQ